MINTETMKNVYAYQWWVTAHISDADDPYDDGHTEERPCSKVYMNREIAKQRKPKEEDIYVGSSLGGCYVINIYLKTIKAFL